MITQLITSVFPDKTFYFCQKYNSINRLVFSINEDTIKNYEMQINEFYFCNKLTHLLISFYTKRDYFFRQHSIVWSNAQNME